MRKLKRTSLESRNEKRHRKRPWQAIEIGRLYGASILKNKILRNKIIK